ncbi:MAG: hypothetical protein AVDCRST_MAG48-3804, partial [uncultured Friedmanniella sp.]
AAGRRRPHPGRPHRRPGGGRRRRQDLRGAGPARPHRRRRRRRRDRRGGRADRGRDQGLPGPGRFAEGHLQRRRRRAARADVQGRRGLQLGRRPAPAGRERCGRRAGGHRLPQRPVRRPPGQGVADRRAHRPGGRGRRPGGRQGAVRRHRERGVAQPRRPGGHLRGRDRARRQVVPGAPRARRPHREGRRAEPGVRHRRPGQEDDERRGARDRDRQHRLAGAVAGRHGDGWSGCRPAAPRDRPLVL